MAKRGLQSAPPPGTRVQLTGYFLKATGQYKGGDAAGKWKVVACPCGLCKSGDYVAVNEPQPEDYIKEMWSDIPKADWEKEGLLWRHFAIGNLQIVGKLPHSRDLSDAPELVAGKKSPAQLDAEIAASLALAKGRR